MPATRCDSTLQRARQAGAEPYQCRSICLRVTAAAGSCLLSPMKIHTCTAQRAQTKPKSVFDVVACRQVKPSGMLGPACMWRDLFSLHHAHKLMMPGLPSFSRTLAHKGIRRAFI